jgi:hypothetical protein
MTISCKNPKLVYPRIDNKSNQLKLNGYYYFKGVGVNESLVSVNFYYSNGVMLHVGGFRLTLKEIDEYIKKYILNYNYSKYKLGWGVYNLNGNKILFERWYPSSGGPMPIFVNSGFILNDSTFTIELIKNKKGNKINSENETYHFRQFSPKPDSTNKWIK